MARIESRIEKLEERAGGAGQQSVTLLWSTIIEIAKEGNLIPFLHENGPDPVPAMIFITSVALDAESCLMKLEDLRGLVSDNFLADCYAFRGFSDRCASRLGVKETAGCSYSPERQCKFGTSIPCQCWLDQWVRWGEADSNHHCREIPKEKLHSNRASTRPTRRNPSNALSEDANA